MAVNQQPKLAKDFWGHFNRGVAIVIVLTQILLLIGVALLLHFVGFFNDNPVAYVGTLVAQTILSVIAAAILYAFVARPLKDLLAAIIHVSGEPTATTPPNPNDERYSRSGFKDVLQTIYQLASDEKPKTVTPGAGTPQTVNSVVEAALNETS